MHVPGLHLPIPSQLPGLHLALGPFLHSAFYILHLPLGGFDVALMWLWGGFAGFSSFIIHPCSFASRLDVGCFGVPSRALLTRYPPGRRGRLPVHAPLRTVRESFPSYGSSRSNRCALRGHAAAAERRTQSSPVTPEWPSPLGSCGLSSVCARQNSGAGRSIGCSGGRRGWPSPGP